MACDPREAVGPAYDLAAICAAQGRAWEALHRTAALIRPGMTEQEGVACGRAVLAEMGMEREWHPLLVRFGTNTIKVFADRSPGSPVLGLSDIFFIDMGPVFDGHEADVGATFTTGSDARLLACARDARQLFEQVKTIWRDGAVVGPALYDAAQAQAKALGWQLNLDIQGHRVGDYPHAIHPGGKLAAFDGVPSPGLWILEIQIRHPAEPFGAFYEDLLV